MDTLEFPSRNHIWENLKSDPVYRAGFFKKITNTLELVKEQEKATTENCKHADDTLIRVSVTFKMVRAQFKVRGPSNVFNSLIFPKL